MSVLDVQPPPPAGHGLGRLVAFADAVVAIAMTLLVLPLVELPGRLSGGESIIGVLVEAHNELIAFTVSFLVIWRLWLGHHRIFGHYQDVDTRTMTLNLLWLSTIVILPFPTALLSTPTVEHGAVTLYAAVLLANTLTLQAMAWRGRRQPSAPAVRLDWTTPLCMTAALVASVVAPSAGPWVLLILLGTPVLDTVNRRRRRRKPGPTPRVSSPRSTPRGQV